MMGLQLEENTMRKWLHGYDNTGYGAKFAREDHMEANPGSTVTIGYDRSKGRKFLDIIPAKVVRMPPQLRLVVNNG